MRTLDRYARILARYGRRGDTVLAHISPEEAEALRARGGAATRNPVTGLPEFWTDPGDSPNAEGGVSNADAEAAAAAAAGGIGSEPVGKGVAPGFRVGPTALFNAGVPVQDISWAGYNGVPGIGGVPEHPGVHPDIGGLARAQARASLAALPTFDDTPPPGREPFPPTLISYAPPGMVLPPSATGYLPTPLPTATPPHRPGAATTSTTAPVQSAIELPADLAMLGKLYKDWQHNPNPSFAERQQRKATEAAARAAAFNAAGILTDPALTFIYGPVMARSAGIPSLPTSPDWQSAAPLPVEDLGPIGQVHAAAQPVPAGPLAGINVRGFDVPDTAEGLARAVLENPGSLLPGYVPSARAIRSARNISDRSGQPRDTAAELPR